MKSNHNLKDTMVILSFSFIRTSPRLCCVFLMRNVWGEDKEENHREMFEKDKVFSIRDGQVDACLWEYRGRYLIIYHFPQLSIWLRRNMVSVWTGWPGSFSNSFFTLTSTWQTEFWWIKSSNISMRTMTQRSQGHVYTRLSLQHYQAQGGTSPWFGSIRDSTRNLGAGIVRGCENYP